MYALMFYRSTVIFIVMESWFVANKRMRVNEKKTKEHKGTLSNLQYELLQVKYCTLLRSTFKS